MVKVPAKLVVAARRIVGVAIVAGIAATLARSVWFFAAGPQPVALAAVSRPAAAPDEKASTAAIVAANLFGDAKAAAGMAASDVENTPDTRLNLVLAAVYQADRPDGSIAVIAAGNRAPEAYRVGDGIPGGARLVEIHRGQVVLSRDGAREKLRFDEHAAGFVAARDDGAQAVAAMGPGVPSSPAAPRPSADAPLLRELGAEYRQRLRQDPEGALGDIGLQPVSPSEALGYRVGALADAPQLARTGLQSGDVILSVNGRPVGQARRDQLGLDEVIGAGSARIEVQRGERRFFITASLR